MSNALAIGFATNVKFQPDWTLDKAVNGVQTLNITVVSVDGTYRPAMDDVVIFSESSDIGGGVVGWFPFHGFITGLREQGVGEVGKTAITTRITAIDFNTYPSRRYVFDTFPAGTLKAQLTQLLAWATGGTLHASQATGPAMPAVTYDGVKALTVVQEFAERAGGWLWENTGSNIFRMWAPGDLAAPWNITTANRVAMGDVSVEPDHSSYANIVIAVAGALTSRRPVIPPAGSWYELLITAPDGTSQADLDALATATLARVSQYPRRVRYTTRSRGLEPGRTQTITLPARNLSGTFLITEVRTHPLGKTNQVVSDVTAIEGTNYLQIANWRDQWRFVNNVMLGSAAGMGTVVGGGGGGGGGPYFTFPIRLKEYGAAGVSAAADTAAVNAAIAALPANGGDILCGDGTFLINASVTIQKDNVNFIGAGQGSVETGADTASTKFKWTGAAAGTMFKFYGTTAVKQLRGGGFQGVALDSDTGLCGTLLDIRSQVFGKYYDLLFMQPSAYNIRLGTMPDNPGDTLNMNTQCCVFESIKIMSYLTTGRGIYCTGSPNLPILSNTSYNVFRNMLIWCNDVEEILIDQGDNNVFSDVRTFHQDTLGNPGSGYSITLTLTGGHGAQGGGYCCSNQFYHCAPQGGVEQKGNATQNAFYEYDRSQGAPAPTITAGVLLYTESLLGGGSWRLPVDMYVTHSAATSSDSNPGYHATNLSTSQAAGMEMTNHANTFKGNLTYRNTSNALLPNTVALLANNVPIVLGANLAQQVVLPAVGTGLVVSSGAAIGTTATDGFLYVPTCAGQPTGTPTTQTGSAPVIWDTTNKIFWIYDGGWKPLPYDGTYTPGLVNGANVAASGVATCQWLRVKDKVTVSGALTIDPTAAGSTLTILDIGLPIASNFGATEHCGGVGASLGGGMAGAIIADAANDRASFRFDSLTTANTSFAFTFTYRII